jgi:hypothetical protein
MSDSPGKHRKRNRSARQAIKGRIHRLVNNQHRKPKITPPPSATGYTGQPNEEFHLPSSFSDLGDGQNWLRIGPLMLTILMIGMAWILVIAYFVSQMPENK